MSPGPNRDSEEDSCGTAASGAAFSANFVRTLLLTRFCAELRTNLRAKENAPGLGGGVSTLEVLWPRLAALAADYC